MKLLKYLFIFAILLIIPLKSYAIFHDEWTTYFFNNINTGEIKYTQIHRDIDAGYFNYSLREYLDGKTINKGEIFDNWDFIEVNYYRRNNTHYLNEGIYNYLDLHCLNYNSCKEKNDLIKKGTNLNTYNIKEFGKNDLNNNELFFYYKFIILNYLIEFILFLPFNLVVFYFFGDYLYKRFLNKQFKNKKIRVILFISLFTYILTDILLYSFGLGYGQIIGNLGGIFLYNFNLGFIKLILFIIGIISIAGTYLNYKKTKKKNN